MVCQLPNGRPNLGTGVPKNIWDAKHKGNGQVKNNIFGLSKQIEILNGTPIFFLFHALCNKNQ